ncbi:unnamed protein product [Echinostoma caproni]|uniref:G_PROTEIN_RECEP_F1_2 domain-containing protein n=1 Tax=Echinostoma caproni TaxID=27848 RepID=A0A183AT99_9TREM|nr:unnamed protein product [Echinostoma caproni]
MNPSVLAVHIMIGVLGGSGLILNTVVLYFLCQTQLTSKLTTTLMRSQSVADGYSSLIIILYQILGPQIHTGSDPIDRLLCWFWSHDQLFWFGVSLSVHNIVCISFDRLIAVVRPIQYRLHQTYLLVVCYVYLIGIVLFLFVPNFLLRDYHNGTCWYGIPQENTAKSRFLVLHSYFWFTLAYLLPALFVVLCHAMIIRYLRRSQAEVASETPGQGGSINVKRIVTVTAGMAANLLLFHACECVRYSLAAMNVIRYAAGSPEQQAGILLITISFCINPCLLLYTKASLFVTIRDCICLGIPRVWGRSKTVLRQRQGLPLQ